MSPALGYVVLQSHIWRLVMRKIKITAELGPAEEGGYVVYCPELDITTEGDTVEEAIYMIKDAAAGYIDVVGIENIPSVITS
jgi:predicted RNase H-like HicB family nuclease